MQARMKTAPIVPDVQTRSANSEVAREEKQRAAALSMTNVAGPADSSRARIIAYWFATVMVAAQLGSGGAGDILRIQPVVEGMAHLGYPAYFCVILGVWKALGAVALLVPRFPRLKEWAYAGAVFDLTGAVASHLAVGDGANKLAAPIIFIGLVVASWALRPATRRDIARVEAHDEKRAGGPRLSQSPSPGSAGIPA